MAKEYKRTQRIESLIQSELGRMIHDRYEQFRSQLISISHIKVTPDLSYAKIYIILLSGEDPTPVVQFLNQEAKALRYLLAQNIQLRKIPEIRFYFDESSSEGERISELLHEAEKQL